METKQKQTNHDWIYLLPEYQTANNMKDACEIIAEQKGHKFGSNSFNIWSNLVLLKRLTGVNLPDQLNAMEAKKQPLQN